MLAENDVGLRETVEQTVVHHRLRAGAEFLGRLEHGIRVPAQPDRSSASTRAAPSRQVVCRSWPHAWATGTVEPSASVAVAVLA